MADLFYCYNFNVCLQLERKDLPFFFKKKKKKKKKKHKKKKKKKKMRQLVFNFESKRLINRYFIYT